MHITVMTSADAGFYPTLGPFLANKDVHEFIGGVPWDETTKTWLVATENDAVVGFCAVNQLSRRTLLESLYVTAEHRVPEGADGPITVALVERAVAEFGHDRDLHATVRTETAPALTDAGFAPVGGRAMKNFARLVRPATVRRKEK